MSVDSGRPLLLMSSSESAKGITSSCSESRMIVFGLTVVVFQEARLCAARCREPVVEKEDEHGSFNEGVKK